MKISKQTLQKVEKNPLDLAADELHELKVFYKSDNHGFTNTLEQVLSGIHKKEDTEKFLFLCQQLKKEVLDVAPFVSKAMNAFFMFMIKNHCYRQITENTELFECAANITVFQLLHDLIGHPGTFRFLKPLEVYRLKRLVMTLSKKFKREDIAYSIQMDLEKEDMSWLDSVE